MCIAQLPHQVLLRPVTAGAIGLLLHFQATKPTFRLHIYVQLGCKRSSTGAAESSLASEVSCAVLLRFTCLHSNFAGC